ncbi:MAG: SUMF1/EgtB/PvdO family nonheme iron enzyme [Microscillaceae bacterium]|nr:SUMF1/EgtB/PvdO family nonheme iron enzyme [Microscillaceae bacterium]
MKKLILCLALTWIACQALAQDNCLYFDRLIKKGNDLYQKGEYYYNQAVQKYTAALLACPNRAAEAQKAIANVFEQVQKLKRQAEEAQENMRNTIQILAGNQDNYYRYFYQKGEKAYQLGEYEDALNNFIFAGIANDKPTNNDIQKRIQNTEICLNAQNRAYALLQKAQYEAAEKEIAKAIQLNPQARRTLLIAAALNPAKYALAQLPAGEFMMGCDSTRDNNCNESELPRHNVRLDAFQMGQYEVTNLAYCVFLNRYNSDEVKEGAYKGQTMIYEHAWGIVYDETLQQWRTQYPEYELHPVVYVTWYGANEFCQYYGGSLPTEAQWEYAARSAGKDNYIYVGSDDIDEVAWYNKTSKGTQTFPVGLLKPNEKKLYDMSGNVWEWCLDWYDSRYYETSSKAIGGTVENPTGAVDGSYRVLRGGSWSYLAGLCRVAHRS